jgi:hypothetical protein
MTEIERLTDRLQRAFYRDAWCGRSLLETLEGVTAGRRLLLCDAARPSRSTTLLSRQPNFTDEVRADA